MTFLQFRDEDGDPIYVNNDIVAIYSEVDKTEIRSFMGVERHATTGDVMRVVISRSSGRWQVSDSFEDILDQIDAVTCG